MTMNISQPSLFQYVGPFGKVLAVLNIGILFALPITWFQPLLRSSAFVFLSSEVSIWSAVQELYKADLFLFWVIVVFAMFMPLFKTLIFVYLWFASLRPRPISWAVGSIAAKLSMTDVFLLAISIAVARGGAIGQLTALWGLYAFSGVVIVAFLISVYTDVQLKRFALKAI